MLLYYDALKEMGGKKLYDWCTVYPMKQELLTVTCSDQNKFYMFLLKKKKKEKEKQKLLHYLVTFL